MLENGFVLLHRSLLKWEWYGDLPTTRLFVHLLLTVNYEKRRWQGIEVGRGQRVASLSRLAAETGLSVKQVRTALGRLKRTGEVTQETGPKYSLFTVCGYERYQAGGDVRETRPAEKGQAWGNNETKEHEKNEDDGARDKIVSLTELYEQCLGEITPYAAGQLADWAKRLSPEEVARAVREAGAHHAHSWRYVETILRRSGGGAETAQKKTRPAPRADRRPAGRRSFLEIAQEAEDDLSGDGKDDGGAAGGFS